MIDRARQLLSAVGLPPGDRYDLPTSSHAFVDGGQFRIEIPSVEGPNAMRAVIEEAAKHGISIHRVSQGSGIGLLSDADIRDMVTMGADAGIEVCLFVGPRAPWEGSASALTVDGRLVGWRHTGMDQLAYALADLFRATDLGIRSVLVADEGLIWLIHRGKGLGRLPTDLVVKASALLGLANPVGIRLLAELGLGSANVSSDITLPKLAALRQVCTLPVDLYVESPDSLGGFMRYPELPELVRLGAPIYLKFGLRNAIGLYPTGGHLESVAVATGRERVRRAALGVDVLRREYPDATASPAPRHDAGVPIRAAALVET